MSTGGREIVEQRLRFPDGASPLVAAAGREAYAPEPPPAGGRREGRSVALDDGTNVMLRDLRSGDRATVRRLFARLSPSSRRSRFLAPVGERDLDRMLPRLADAVDQHWHIAVVMMSGSGPVGVARLIRSPTAPHVADVAVAVADRWQRRGAGRLLIREVVSRATGLREIRTVLGRDNEASLRLLSQLGPLQTTGAGGVYVVVDLTASDGSGEGSAAE